MAVTVASLQAVLDLNNKKFDDGLKKSSNKLNDFMSDFKSGFASGLGISAFDLGAKALVGMGQALTDSIAAARESAKVNKQLEATLLATGGAAGVTADAARDLATSLQRTTSFEDDAIIGAENLMLTFTSIGKDVFPQAIETVLDMSQVMGQDLKSSAIQLGKALNDPAQGLGALTRIGVSFTDQQKEQIKTMQAAGDMAGAQAVILNAIATQGFGGAAKAMADPFIQLQNAIGDTQETLGGALLPILNQLAQVILPGVQMAFDGVDLSIGTLSGEELANLQTLFGGLIAILPQFIGSFGELGGALTSLGQQLGIVSDKSTAWGGTLKIIGLVIGAFLAPIKVLGQIISVLATIIGAADNVMKESSAGFERWGAVVNTTKETISPFTSILQTLKSAWQELSTFVSNGVAGWQRFQYAIAGIIAKAIQLTGVWQRLVAVMSQGISLPPVVTPGSPTPLEMGLRGISEQLRTMPSLGGAFGGMGGPMMATASAGGSGSTINVNIGGVSASTTTNGNAPDEAIAMVVQMLRQQLEGV